MTVRPHCRRYAAALAFGGLLAAAAAPNIAEGAARRIPPWCAFEGGQFGFDCGYYTFEQCMETARGLGNYCVRNPRLPEAGWPPRQQRRVKS